MTVDKLRFGDELELPPEAAEMMAKITELTGCAVDIPEEAKRRIKDTCESMGTTPQRVFACIMDGVLAAIENGVADVFIQLRLLEDPGHGSESNSDQVNGKPAIGRKFRISSSEFRPSRIPAVKAITNVPNCPNLGHFPASQPGSRSSSFEFRPSRVPAVKAVQWENISRWVGSPVQNESLRRRIAVYPVLVQYDTGIDGARVGNGEMTNRVISNGKSKHPSRRKLAMASPACIRP